MADPNRWLTDPNNSDAKGLLMFLGVFIARILIAEWQARRAARKAVRRKVA